MAKRFCTSCDQRLEDEHLCPACGRPTDLATPGERARWEVSVWRKSKGMDDKAPPRRPGAVPQATPGEAPARSKVPGLRQRLANVGASSDVWKDVIELGELGGEPTRPAPLPPAAVPDQDDAAGSTAPSMVSEVPAPHATLSAPPPPMPAVTVSTEDLSIEVRDDDRAQSALLKEILRDRDVFVDVGARTGAMSFLAAVRVGERGRVVAIEPNGGAVEYLQRVVAQERLANVTVVQAAVGVDPAAGTRPLDSIVRRLGLGRVDLLRLEVGSALPGVLDGIRAFVESPTLVGPVLVTVDRRAMERDGYSLDLVERAFPVDAWADTTGLRFGGFDRDAATVPMMFERR